MHSYQSDSYGVFDETSPYEKLKCPPIRKDFSHLPDEDQKFLLEHRKRDIYRQKLFVRSLSLIREFDYLPKGVVNECFTKASKHVYEQNDKQHILEMEESLSRDT